MRLIALAACHNKNNNDDTSHSIITVEILTQLELHFAVISATVPCLRIFLKALHTGYLGTTLEDVDPTNTRLATVGSQDYGKSSHAYSHTLSYTRSKETPPHCDTPLELGPHDRANTSKAVHEAPPDAESVASDSSDRIMIRKTVDIIYA